MSGESIFWQRVSVFVLCVFFDRGVSTWGVLRHPLVAFMMALE